MEKITRDNLRLLLAGFIEKNDLTTKKISKAIGCSEKTLTRILARKTHPSDEMIKQVGALIGIGYEMYSKLSKAEKEKISELIGTIGGGTLGFASIAAVISSLGIAGLSAAGISTGLAALGALVGGGMLTGISVAAAIPIAAGALGYGIIKGIKYLISGAVLNSNEIDEKWEILLDIEE